MRPTGTEIGKNFSNPMYEEISHMETEAGSSALYHTVDDLYQPPPGEAKGAVGGPAEFKSGAVIMPSSVIQKSSPQVLIKHKELDPSIDTGKDTQQLVEEDGGSEC